MSVDKIEIYKIHVQAADKIDERRDITVRTYGGICGVIAAIAASMILKDPAVSSDVVAIFIDSCVRMERNPFISHLKIDGKSNHIKRNGRTTISIIPVLN